MRVMILKWMVCARTRSWEGFREDLELRSKVMCPLWNYYQNSSITVLFSRRPGVVTRNSCKNPDKNSTGTYFGKSPFPVPAPFPGEGKGLLPDPEKAATARAGTMTGKSRTHEKWECWELPAFSFTAFSWWGHGSLNTNTKIWIPWFRTLSSLFEPGFFLWWRPPHLERQSLILVDVGEGFGFVAWVGRQSRVLSPTILLLWVPWPRAFHLPPEPPPHRSRQCAENAMFLYWGRGGGIPSFQKYETESWERWGVFTSPMAPKGIDGISGWVVRLHGTMSRCYSLCVCVCMCVRACVPVCVCVSVHFCVCVCVSHNPSLFVLCFYFFILLLLLQAKTQGKHIPPTRWVLYSMVCSWHGLFLTWRGDNH